MNHKNAAMLQIALIQSLLQSSQVEQKVNRPNKHIQNQLLLGPE